MVCSKPAVALTNVAVFRCPDDSTPELQTWNLFTPFNAPVGDTFAPNSYALSMGYNDAFALAPSLGPKRPDPFTGVFFLESQTRLAQIRDGQSNTFAIGEASSGIELGEGLGSTVESNADPGISFHGWIVGLACPSEFYGAGFRYTGGFCSTVEPLNKWPVTDSYFDRSSSASLSDARASWQGGPHWASNFRSEHTGGAGFAFCDGHVRFISENVDMDVYRATSTMSGGEVQTLGE